MKRKLLGQLGELITKNFLKKRSLIYLSKNFHCKYGEIDLIFKQRGRKELVFCEVKTKTTRSINYVPEVLSKKQIKRIINSIFIFLEKNKYYNYDWRLDLVIILIDFKKMENKILHYKNILLE